MDQPRNAWDFELSHELTLHRPTLMWLPDHINMLVPPGDVVDHLLSMDSDLCDAGHIHLDILMWLLTDHSLHAIIISEEHFDHGPEAVETTFETTVSNHPLDTVVGTQLSTASHPDGTQLDVSLAVMLNTPGTTGHVDPVALDADPELFSYAVSLQPSSLSFIVAPERTEELAAFADHLMGMRGEIGLS